MRQMAREAATATLSKYQQPALDPDQVYFNRFTTAVSAPTYSGWAHHERPVQSLTLPQLVMQRFDVNDQDNADLLSDYTGFYTAGANKAVFDASNQIPIDPQRVLEDFWAFDFSSVFHQRLTAFWQQHADDFCVLAKTNFMAKVMEVCADHPGSELAKRSLLAADALGSEITSPVTLEHLRRTTTPAQGSQLRSLDIGGYVASDILRIAMTDGAELVYVPGEVDALHLFANRNELYWWVLSQTNARENRARFMSHFALACHAEHGSDVGLNHQLDLMFYHWGGDDGQYLNQRDQRIQGDAFIHLRDSAHQRMLDDAHFALRSNSDLRKQLWIGYLKAFGQVFGPMAALNWPIALAVVGAGLADTGLNIDQAVNGHTTAERRAGVVGAVFAAIDTLFNATLLASVSGALGEELVEAGAGEPSTEIEPQTPLSSSELEARLPEPFQPKAPDQLLAGFESNEILNGAPGSGELAGVYTQQGQFYVLIDDLPYQVRYVGESTQWVVVDPESPFSFARHVPLQRTPEGAWQPMARNGLKGGKPPKALLKLLGISATPSALPPLEVTPYEVPAARRATFMKYDISPQNRVISGDHFSFDAEANHVYEEYAQLRDRLAADATQYIHSATLPERPQTPDLASQASPKQIIRGIYENTDGLVIGESHSALGSKRFLIDNMAELKKQQVKVLYMEHYTTDFQQVELDQFNRTGQLPDKIQRYIKAQDFGHITDRSGHYTFENVMLKAQQHGIRIQAIDCMASYAQAWAKTPSPLARQQMMNYFAHLIIDADQLIRGKSRWVALVGNTHANSYEGVPGLSEMQKAIGLRVVDIDIGQPGGIGVDPGFPYIDENITTTRIKSELLLRAPLTVAQAETGSLDALPPPAVEDSQLEQRLSTAGDFMFITRDNRPSLVHRNRVGQLVFTPILVDDHFFYIDNSRWPWADQYRTPELKRLKVLFERNGMHYKPAS
ncbi:dermonecrotic toxin domain-containing protein [Pseudomonas reidholzensis]